MQLISVSVGQPQLTIRGGRQYSTAINKRPVDGAVPVDKQGLESDRSADSENHGGVDKAVCCFPSEHYAFFAEKLGVADLEIPAFGENFTTSGLLEHEICIGDRFRANDVVFQVSQPRQPCWKLANKHECKDLAGWVVESQYCGFYLRVLAAGEIMAGVPFEIVDRPHEGATVAAALAAMYASQPDMDMLQRFCGIEELTGSWREKFAKRMEPGDD